MVCKIYRAAQINQGIEQGCNCQSASCLWKSNTPEINPGLPGHIFIHVYVKIHVLCVAYLIRGYGALVEFAGALAYVRGAELVAGDVVVAALVVQVDLGSVQQSNLRVPTTLLC